MKQISFFLLVCLLISNQSKSQSCNNLPDKFYSYSEAINKIQNTSFEFTDKLPYGKSSWIMTANYYSCDSQFGYLVYSTKQGNRYIHENVPINVWYEFKNASSSGSYYGNYIKGRYRFVPN
jgi:hypothetical protein